MVDTVRIHVYSISGRLFLEFLVNISALESIVTGNADETEMVTESNSNIRNKVSDSSQMLYEHNEFYS